MNSLKEKRHIVDVLFVLGLFCVFAFSSLVLVSIGASIYQTTIDNMDANYTTRTSFSYITEKIRQNDFSGAVSIGTIADKPAILLSQSIGEEEYVTYLYENNGFLTELLIKSNSDVGENILNAGQPILEIESFEFHKIEESLFRFKIITKQEEPVVFYVSTQSNL